MLCIDETNTKTISTHRTKSTASRTGSYKTRNQRRQHRQHQQCPHSSPRLKAGQCACFQRRHAPLHLHSTAPTTVATFKLPLAPRNDVHAPHHLHIHLHHPMQARKDLLTHRYEHENPTPLPTTTPHVAHPLQQQCQSPKQQAWKRRHAPTHEKQAGRVCT